jgi:hypothetical protein
MAGILATFQGNVALTLSIGRNAQKRFVDERGRLQRLVRVPLACEPCSRDFAQFVIDFGQQLATTCPVCPRLWRPQHVHWGARPEDYATALDAAWRAVIT